MRRLNRLTALCVGVLLLAAPAAFACGEIVAMASQCPMAEMPEMVESTGASMCHPGGQMLSDCCEVRSDSDPTPALLFESAKLYSALDASDLRAVVPPVVPAPYSESVEAFGLHDLERYTLYSSFLL